MELASSPPWPPKIPGCHRWSKAQLVTTRKVAVVPLAPGAAAWQCQALAVPGTTRARPCARWYTRHTWRQHGQETSPSHALEQELQGAFDIFPL